MNNKEIYNLLKTCFDKRNRIIYAIIKKDPQKYFNSKGLLEVYLKYKNVFENHHILYKYLIENKLLKADKKHQNKNKCLICGNETKFTTFSQGYRKTCGKQICNLTLGNKTNLIKYGVKNTFQSEIFKEKLKQTKKEKYGYENFNNREKAKNSCNIKYGVENPSQLNEIKEKKIKTNISKYGVRWYNNIEKIKKTNLDKYGIEYILQSEIIKNKMIQTMKEKYGFDNPSKIKEFQDKKIKTNLKNHGVKWYNNVEKHKLTIKYRYGVENISQVKEVKNKIRENKEKNKEWIPLEQLNDFELYRRQVWIYTRKNDLNILKNYDLRSNKYHLDHKYSIKQGFKDNIPPYIIGSIFNLEIIHYKLNISKKDKCSITKEELFKSFFI